MIDAAAAYVLGTTGDFVVVAVIDSGVDTTHTELDGNISPDSIDIVRGRGVPGGVIDEIGHGTFVAGIIAAERDSIGFHGVAYDSKILAVRVDREVDNADLCSPDPAPCSVLLTSDVVDGVVYATSRADVINLSLGGPTPSAPLAEVLTGAAGAGVIIVAAVGNENTPAEPAPEPQWPAAYAGDATVNADGQLIAVGAVDSSGTIADFSNRCGSAKDFCLVAPGVDIISTIPDDTSTASVAPYSRGSGTSFAAPYVSGGAALLLQMFPTLAPADVVQILLVTATDLGAAGVDRVYGHGLLNLARAVQPVGVLSVPLTDSATGKSADLAATMLSLGPAFGDALSNNPLLDRTIALDDFDRPYVAGLGAGVRRNDGGFGLQAMLTVGDAETVETELPGGLLLAMGVRGTEGPESPAARLTMDGMENAPVLRGLSLSGGTEGGATFQLAYDVAAARQFSAADDAVNAGLYWMADDMLNPHYGFVGIGNGLTLSHELGGATTATLGWVEHASTASTADTAGDAWIGELAVTHRIDGGARLRAGFAVIDETGGFLGSDAAGAFAVEGASSRIYTASALVPLTAGVELTGSYTLVDATMEPGGTSLLSGWGAIRADAFGLGVAQRGVFSTNDRIGLMVGQPLRVSDAEASLTLPVGYTLDKMVIQDSRRVSLVPTGREIDLQIAYDTELAGESRLSGWLMMQLEPGHVAEAGPAYGIGLRFNAGF